MTFSDFPERLQRQLQFIAEVDKLKSVLRRTSPIGAKRRENSAEHSWQVILCALMLREHANEEIDLLRVLTMLAVHDVVEVDAGDTFHYDKASRADLAEREAAAAERLFGLLPPDQAQEYRTLWMEFESQESAEARFAVAVDRFSAFIMNHHNGGGTWVEHNVAAEQILDHNKHIRNGSLPIWEAVEAIVNEALSKGLIRRTSADG